MISFKQFLTEGKVLSLQISNEFPTKVFHNPTKEQVKNQSWKYIRTLKHNKDHYVWNAEHATHHAMSQALGIPHQDTEQGFFSKDQLINTHNGDYKKAHNYNFSYFTSENISEGKVIDIKTGYGNPVKVFHNPSNEQIKNKPWSDVRVLKHKNDHYVWNAHDAVHHSITKPLGIPYHEAERSMFSINHLNIYHKGDYKKAHKENFYIDSVPTSLENVNEGKVIDVPLGFKVNVKVFHNPSNEQIKNQDWNDIRILKHGNNHYVWNAHDAIHQQISQGLGISHDETTQSWFPKAKLYDKFYNGDYKKAHAHKSRNSANDNISEGKVIDIEPRKNNLLFKPVKVFQNPTKEQIRNQPWEHVRVLKHGNDHYVWNAHNGIHAQVADGLGIPFNQTEQSFFTKRTIDHHYHGDYKLAHKEKRYRNINVNGSIVYEGKVLDIPLHWHSDHYSDSVKVFHNPSNEQVKNQNWRTIRTLKHGNDHYVWNAHDAIHAQVADGLGIPFNKTQQGYFSRDWLNKNDGDYKKAHNNDEYGVRQPLDKIYEGKVLNVSNPWTTWNGESRSRDIKVFHNPSNEQVKNQNWRTIRTLKHGNDHYVWNAHDATHATISDGLGIKPSDTEQGYFSKDVLDVNNGDYKKAHQKHHQSLYDENITEGKVLNVPSARGLDFKVFHNPTKEQIKNQKWNMNVRILKHKNDHYVWNADYAVHAHVSDKLGIPYHETEQSYFSKNFLDHNFNGDYKKSHQQYVNRYNGKDDEDINEGKVLYENEYDDILASQRRIEGIRAASKHPITGRIYTGRTHRDAISKMNLSPQQHSNWTNSRGFGRDHGFMVGGKFIPRWEAKERFGKQDAKDLVTDSIITFKDFITEGKVLTVSSPWHTNSIKVLHNPTNTQIKNQPWISIRILKHKNDHYVWDGYGADHYTVAHCLGIPFDHTEQSLFHKKEIEKNYNGDYKTAHKAKNGIERFNRVNEGMENEYRDLLHKQRDLEGLRAAIRDPANKSNIFTSGRDHREIWSNLPNHIRDRIQATRKPVDKTYWLLDSPHIGFMDRKGSFLSREEAEKKHMNNIHGGHGTSSEDIEDEKVNNAGRIKRFKDHMRENEYDDILNKRRELEGLTAAIRDPADKSKIYTGESHHRIYHNLPKDVQYRVQNTLNRKSHWDLDSPHVGFKTHKGSFLTRHQAERRFKTSVFSNSPGKGLSSEDLENVKDWHKGGSS